MHPLLPVLISLVATYVVGRFYDLRRLDDPFVTSFIFMTVLWVVGAGQGSSFLRFPQPSPTVTIMLFGGYAALTIGGVLVRVLRHDMRDIRPMHDSSGSGVHAEVLMLAIGGVLTAAFVVISGGIPVLQDGGEQARVDARAGLGYLVILAIWLLSFPTVAIVAHDHARHPGFQKRSWLLVAVAATAIAIYGNRAPVLVLLIASWWVALAARGRLPAWRSLVIAATVALVAVAVAGTLRSGSSAADLFGRLQWQFFVNASNLERVVRLIPEHEPFLHGRSYLIDLAVLLPGPQPNFATWLKETIGMEFPGGGITVGLLGETYANWGTAASVAVSLAFGAVAALVGQLMRARSPRGLAFSVLISLTAAGIVQSGFASVMLYGLLPLVAVFGVSAGLRTLEQRARRYRLSEQP